MDASPLPPLYRDGRPPLNLRLRQVARLKNRFRCVTVDLPGFSADDCGVEKWGYTTDVVVKRIETTVLKEGKGEPVILVAHDWGW